MKKTQSTSIAGTLFYIEEDAFDMLDTYLKDIKTQFKNVPERDEIISDIEARVAELFLEKTNESRIVQKELVEELIKNMGNPQELGDTEKDTEDEKTEEKRGPKKFYRDGNNMVVAGVCSGIAAFFNIDPLIVRIIFILFTLFTDGSGFLVYLILWLVIPLAKTTTEKLEMKGSRITLESVKEAINEKIEEVDTEKVYSKGVSVIKKILEFPIRVIESVFSFLKNHLFPFVGKGVGVVIVFAALVVFLCLTLTLMLGTFATTVGVFDPTWYSTLENSWYYIALFAGYVSIIVPTIFIVSLGLALVRMKNVIKPFIGFSLLGIWFVSLLGLGVSATVLVDKVNNTLQTEGDTTKTLALSEFNSIEAEDALYVTIEQGTTTEVTLEGTPTQIQGTNVSLNNQNLFIGGSKEKKCVFCFNQTARVHIITPNLTSLTAKNATHITSTNTLLYPTLSLHAENNSKIKVDVENQSLEALAKNASSIKIQGKTETFSVSTKNASSVNSTRLSAIEITADAENASEIYTGMATKLKATASDASTIRYSGTPELIQNQTNYSEIEQINNEEGE